MHCGRCSLIHSLTDAAVHNAMFISTTFSYLNSTVNMWLDTKRTWTQLITDVKTSIKPSLRIATHTWSERSPKNKPGNKNMQNDLSGFVSDRSVFRLI